MTTPDSAEDHLVTLLDALSGFAKKQLDQTGGFDPFGAYIDLKDELALAAAVLDDDETEDPYQLLQAVFNGLRDQARQGAIHAAGYCVNVGMLTTGEENATDAVRVRIEHVQGLSIEVHYPYTRHDEGGYAWGEPTSNPDTLRIFSGPEDPTDAELS